MKPLYEACRLPALALSAVLTAGAFSHSPAGAEPVRTEIRQTASGMSLVMTNDRVTYVLVIDATRLAGDTLTLLPDGRRNAGPPPLITDADFRMEIMWTDWSAPKYFNNAENPVVFTKTDFAVTRYEFVDLRGGGKEIRVDLDGIDMQLRARRTVRLEPADFFVRQGLAVADTALSGHFLQHVWPVDCRVQGTVLSLNPGGFGQPVAWVRGSGGAFIGVEYPAAENLLQVEGPVNRVTCGHEMGEKISRDWLEAETVIMGVTPDTDVKRWFMRYVESLRVTPVRPYTLYNSWYDLRSAEYPKVPASNVMNEENVMRIIGLIRRNMIEKHGIHLDAFVLDDGWDVYESDWVLRPEQFPNGLKPVADELKKTKTDLGLWFGPTGGYSFRMKRVNWMKEHGYEVVGTTKNTAMLCLAGSRYSSLFAKRVVDFVARDGVGYFKWDGIQFSCSEQGHGHPVGIYSRRAVLQSLIRKCDTVRAKNPDVFLNITSGTWLSPWWVKYANQIWMQGQDYGYADVPSISPRDAAITYRDFVLYDDFTNRNWWFPIANLMTHGIIKGNLQMLGGTREPLDRFANEVLLYFARGVSMWELYISPDILTDGEWDVLGSALAWARDRFPVLATTEMVGGDPTKSQTYGYVHFRGSHGILAVRNPWVARGSLAVELRTRYGLDESASGLVLERVYPDHWVAPALYRQGDTVTLPLEGYETAIYEMYPLAEADSPLLGGGFYDITATNDGGGELTVYGSAGGAQLLNSDRFALSSRIGGASPPPPADAASLRVDRPRSGELHVSFALDASMEEASLALLLTPAAGGAKGPAVLVVHEGRTDTARSEESESPSRWYTLPVGTGMHDLVVHVKEGPRGGDWAGTVSAWVVGRQRCESETVRFTARHRVVARVMPPRGLPAGRVARTVRIGEANLP